MPPITSGPNDSTEESLRKLVRIVSTNSNPNDSTEVSLQKLVTLLSNASGGGGGGGDAIVNGANGDKSISFDNLIFSSDYNPASIGFADALNTAILGVSGLTFSNGTIFNSGGLNLDNGAKVQKGTTDAGLGGSKGIALKCSVDYELKWEAGRLYTMQQDGFTIRSVEHCITTPTPSDNSTKGFVIGSRWVTDDGKVYVCVNSNQNTSEWSQIVSDVQNFTLTKTTTSLSQTYLLGSIPYISNGDTMFFRADIVAKNLNTGKTKSWIINGVLTSSFSGYRYFTSGPTISQNGGYGTMSAPQIDTSLNVSVNSGTSKPVQWNAIFTYTKTSSSIIPLSSGCKDNACANYSASAIDDNGSCSYANNEAENTDQIVAVQVNADVGIDSIDYGDPEASYDPISGNSWGPSFSPSISDYWVYNDEISPAFVLGQQYGYKVSLSNSTSISGIIKVGQILKLTTSTSVFYIRFLPRAVRPLSVLSSNNEPTLYLSATDMFGGTEARSINEGYYIIYDQNGTPFWYAKTKYQPLSLHLGRYNNRLITNYYNNLDGYVGFNKNYAIDVHSTNIVKTTLELKNTSDGDSAPSWDLHEAYEVSEPAERRGNIIGVSYQYGFYIQEQDIDGNVVWDWKATDYFDESNAEFYHLNSVDVHPQNGKLLVSLRNVSAIVCIDYNTKQIDWVVSETTDLYNAKKAGISFINVLTEDTLQFHYQHDARWIVDAEMQSYYGETLFSVYDNQSGIGSSVARATIYNLDGTDISVAFSIPLEAQSPYTGSYKFWRYNPGITPPQYRHTIQNTDGQTQFVEYTSGVDTTPSLTLEMSDNMFSDPLYSGTPKKFYRLIPAPAGTFRLNNLRATCGINLEPPISGQGLLFRWSPENATQTENGVVLTDISGNNINSTGENDFVITANAINGLPAISLSGNSIITANTNYAVGLGTPMTMIGVIRVSSGTWSGDNARWFGTNSAPNQFIATFTSGPYGTTNQMAALYGISYNCDNNLGGIELSESDQTKVLVYTQNATEAKLFINGTEISTLQYVDTIECFPTNAATGFVLGGMYGPVLLATGLVGEVMAYDKELSTEERQSIETYLMTKYGVSS